MAFITAVKEHSTDLRFFQQLLLLKGVPKKEKELLVQHFRKGTTTGLEMPRHSSSFFNLVHYAASSILPPTSKPEPKIPPPTP